MSGRLVKKILNEQHQLSQQQFIKEEEDDNEQEEGPTAPSTVNPFDILNDNDSEPENQGKEPWDMNTEEKIEAASKKRSEGIALYKAQKYARASKRFEQALKFVEHDTSFSDEEEKKKVRFLKLFCNFFFRECKIMLNDYKDMVVNDSSSSDMLDYAYIEILKAINDAIRGQEYTTAKVMYGEEANSYSYWDMFNKTKSWILETVMKLGQRMLKP